MDTLSISPDFLRRLSFGSEELATIRAIGEFRGKQDLYSKQSPEILENLRTVAKIESSESSNRIEGIVVARNRVEEIINHPLELLKNRSEQEVAGYRDALQLIHESAEYIPVSRNLVLQLHSLICKYTPNPGGRWKATDNEIIETSSTGEKKIRFKAVSAVQTPHAMNDWETFYRDAIQTIDPLIVAPLAILDFLCIHPFLDGNGRSSRLLTLLLLYKADYQIGRYVSLERVIEQSKESYYETLQKSSQGWHEGNQDIKPWLHYFWGILIKAYRELEEKVSDIKGGKGSKTEMIRQAVKSMVGPFSISDIQDQLPTVGRDMIKLVLADLKAERLIVLQGKGRGAKWVKDLIEKFPDDWWIKSHINTQEDGNPLAMQTIGLYQDLLDSLDPKARSFLKTKAEKEFSGTNKLRGKQQFFNILNEAFAYRYLCMVGGKKIDFVPEEQSKTPDIFFQFENINAYCECKSIAPSDAYLKARKDGVVFSIDQSSIDKFFEKIQTTIGSATKQIQAKKPERMDICVIYIILDENGDIGPLGAYSSDIEAFIKNKNLNCCRIVVQFGLFGFTKSLIVEPFVKPCSIN